MEHWHSNITQDVLRQVRISQNFSQGLPRVMHFIDFEEVVFTPVTTDLELGTCPIGSSLALSFLNRLNNIRFVVIKGQSPLIKLACGQHRKIFMHLINYF